LYSTLVAYTGNYRVEGDKWITKVDASSNPAWVGTDQPRTYKIAGKQLRLCPQTDRVSPPSTRRFCPVM
jgi:hypothetical protein